MEKIQHPVDMVNIPLFTVFYTSQVVSRILSSMYWFVCNFPQFNPANLGFSLATAEFLSHFLLLDSSAEIEFQNVQRYLDSVVSPGYMFWTLAFQTSVLKALTRLLLISWGKTQWIGAHSRKQRVDDEIIFSQRIVRWILKHPKGRASFCRWVGLKNTVSHQSEKATPHSHTSSKCEPVKHGSVAWFYVDMQIWKTFLD